MNILFITSSRLGDAVLSTGLLSYISQKHPEAKVTIACGGLPKTLFDGYPQCETVHVMEKRTYNRHWIDLWKKVFPVRWDMVIDLRDSAVSRLIRADKRYIFSRNIDKTCHKVEQAASLLGLDDVPLPQIWVSKAQKEKVDGFIPEGGPVLGVGPTANWIGKTWPADRFIEVVKHITGPDGILPGARVAVFAAPGEEEDAYTVLNTVPKDKQIDVIAKADPGTAAAILGRCDFYIGNDSGLMHCAAAAGTPTIGVFGPSYPHLYRPWGEHCAHIATPESFDELIDFEGYDAKTLKHTLMTSLETKDVIALVDKFWGQHKKAA